MKSFTCKFPEGTAASFWCKIQVRSIHVNRHWELPSGKIESIVRDLSKERLLDGQFDECKLTLRELHEIEDAIIGRLRSIRHQRLAYPDDQDESVPSDPSS